MLTIALMTLLAMMTIALLVMKWAHIALTMAALIAAHQFLKGLTTTSLHENNCAPIALCISLDIHQMSKRTFFPFFSFLVASGMMMLSQRLACWLATGITSRDGELRWFEDVAWDALRQKAQDTITIDKKRKIHCHLLCGHEDWPSESALMLELRTAKDCWNAFSKMDCYVWLQLSWTWQLFMSCSTVTISFRCSQQQGSGADGAAWALQEIVGIDKAQPRTWLNNLPHCGHWSQVKVVASTDRALAPLKFLLRNTAPKTLLVLLYFHKDINICL